MKQKILKIIAALLVLILPFGTLALLAFATPNVYGDTFVGALEQKFDHLTSITEPKIIIVGGSSTAFGVDSEMLEKYTGMPVVNFGLYAALGTKVMMDLSRANIREGDVIVLAPEIDPQTMSLYFNSDTTLMAADGRPDMLRYVRGDDRLSLAGALWRFTGDKLSYLFSGSRPQPSGAYDPSYFSAAGDLTYPRTENVMGMYYDPNTPITLSPETVDDDFIDYVNEYIRFCEKKGATVYYGYCPMNELAINLPDAEYSASTALTQTDTDSVDDTAYTEYTVASITAFGEYLDSVLDCEILGTPEDHIYSAAYFYDSNFHLNDAGVVLHSVTLVKELLLALGIPAFVQEEIPDAPALPEKDIRYFGEEDENTQYFTFEMTDFGYRITGLTESGKAQTTLTLPIAYDGYRVALLGENALSGGIVEKLIIPAGFEQFITETTSSMMTLENGCFTGASSLKELWIYNRHEATIMPPASFAGVHDQFVVHVPDGSSYGEGYFWGERKLNGVNLRFIADIIME